MPLQATSGAASYDAFGGGAAAVPTYIEDVFSTYLYTGTGSSRSITNGIDLAGKGGLVWTACRSNAYGQIRQTSVGTYLDQTTAAAAADSSGNFITAFNSTGFTIGDGTAINNSGSTFVSWTFRKQPKFFDVVTYTGNGNTFQTINHNLGSTPGCIIVKQTNATTNWVVYHRGIGTDTLRLNLTNAKTGLGGAMLPSSTSVDFYGSGGSDPLNASGGTYVAYLFAHDAGGFGLTGTDNVISCGSFTTDGSGNATVNLGYEPQWLMTKRTDGTSSWIILDNMRQWANGGDDKYLIANGANAELTFDIGNPTATGFFTTAYAASAAHIYIAIRRGPMKVPTDGTKVFNTLAHTGDAGNIEVTGAGFTPDLLISKARNDAQEAGWVDRLRGTAQALFSNVADATNDQTGAIGALGMDGVKTTTAQNGIWNKITVNNAWWFLKRAPSFFDEVCYTGTGANTTFTHNLGVAPELIICKGRSLAQNWIAGSTALANTEYLIFNEPAAKATGATYWNSTYPTSSVFSLGTASEVNNSGSTFVAYLFASCAGVSKVGSYTGNGTTQTINCGFGAGGARFVLLKRTDSTGGWYVYDTARGMTVLTDPYLLMNTNAAEVATLGSVTTVSTGFALDSTILAAINVSGGTYIFLAIA